MNLSVLAESGAVGAFETTILYVGVAALGALLVAFFGVRIWLSRNRPTGTMGVPTPRINQLNSSALDRMTRDQEGAEEVIRESLNEPAPDDLLNVVPPPKEEPPGSRNSPRRPRA